MSHDRLNLQAWDAATVPTPTRMPCAHLRQLFLATDLLRVAPVFTHRGLALTRRSFLETKVIAAFSLLFMWHTRALHGIVGVDASVFSRNEGHRCIFAPMYAAHAVLHGIVGVGASS